MKHPLQPLVKDKHGRLRFKENQIVSYLLEAGRKIGVDMNELAILPFPREDRERFAQLIGYSLSGFGELSYVSDDTYDTATKMSETGKAEQDSRVEMLEEKLENIRNALREACTSAFHIHPDDLHT
jgi:hypothetical protein